MVELSKAGEIHVGKDLQSRQITFCAKAVIGHGIGPLYPKEKM